MFARSTWNIANYGRKTVQCGVNSGKRYLLVACALRRPASHLLCRQPYTVPTGRGFWRGVHQPPPPHDRVGDRSLIRHISDKSATAPSAKNQHKRSASTAEFSPLKTLWNNLFGKYLLATNIISSGVLMVIGDLLAQEIEIQRSASHISERYDLARVWRMFVVGSLQGPLHHYVYNWMDRIMPVQNLRNTIWKILIDQFFMSPACILIFFYTACYLERKSVSDTSCELMEKFPVIYMMDWLMWPAVQFVNFRYLDTKYRVMFVNVCTAVYNVFLSYMKHDFGVNTN